MRVNSKRIENYLDEITAESNVINNILARSENEILKSSHLIRSLKYSIIVVSEAMANVLQYILAKDYSVAITGYKQAFIKANEHGIISEGLFQKLHPFIGFRNLLVHQYWDIDDKLFLKNLRDGLKDFQDFVREINRLTINSSEE